MPRAGVARPPHRRSKSNDNGNGNESLRAGAPTLIDNLMPSLRFAMGGLTLDGRVLTNGRGTGPADNRS
jgi:hypothetical protein